MLVSDIISRVRNIAGDINANQFSDEQVMSWINDGIRECAVDNNLLQKRATQIVVADQSTYDLPSDILKLHSVKYDGTKIKILTLEEFDKQYSGENTGSGVPNAAYIWAGVLNIVPSPDNSTKSLVIDYTRDPIDVDDGNLTPEIPVGYHSRLVDYCLAQVAQQDDDMNRYSIKMQEFRTGVQALKDQPEWENDLYPFISVSERDTGEGGFYG